MAQTIHVSNPPKSEISPGTPKNYYWWHRLVARIKARNRARKIMSSFKEAEQIHSGKKNAQTLDDFLNEL